jgi:hypothetical protein
VRTGATVDAALAMPGAAFDTGSFRLRDDGTGHVLVPDDANLLEVGCGPAQGSADTRRAA